MKIEIEKREIETTLSGQVLGMGIDQSTPFLFDLLRNKLYSNPISAVVREIASNARDAHREAGNPEVPIQITVPTKNHSQLTIRDYGVGMSPERIDKVYRNYFASTKRDSDLQTGAFGLGAKSPFSITDSFTVSTIHNGIKQELILSIGADQRGEVIVLSTEKTTEPNGTTVRIPIPPADAQRCADRARFFTQFWNPIPKFAGDCITADPPTVWFQGTGWKVFTKNPQARHLVDGIPFSCTDPIISRKFPSELFVCEFETSEVQLTPSRESLQYTEKTTEKILNTIETFNKEIVGVVNKTLNSKKTPHEVFGFLNDLSNGNYLGERFLSLNKIMGPWKYKKYTFNYPNLHFSCTHIDYGQRVTAFHGHLFDKLYAHYSRNGKSVVVVNDYDPVEVDELLTLGNMPPKKVLSYELSPLTKKKVREWMIQNTYSNAYYVNPTHGDIYRYFKDEQGKNDVILLSEIAKFKTPKAGAKRGVIIYVFTGKPYAERIDLNELAANPRKFVYKIAHNENTKGAYRTLERDYTTAINNLGYTYCVIDQKYEKKIVGNPCFITVKEFLDKELYAHVKEKEAQKIYDDLENCGKIAQYAWLLNKISPDMLKRATPKFLHEKYVHLFPLIQYVAKNENGWFKSSVENEIQYLLAKYPMAKVFLGRGICDQKYHSTILDYIDLVDKGA